MSARRHYLALAHVLQKVGGYSDGSNIEESKYNSTTNRNVPVKPTLGGELPASPGRLSSQHGTFEAARGIGLPLMIGLGVGAKMPAQPDVGVNRPQRIPVVSRGPGDTDAAST